MEHSATRLQATGLFSSSPSRLFDANAKSLDAHGVCLFLVVVVVGQVQRSLVAF